jgi:endonuclease/exonuclease/phosphatase (EEP) superfamily protein YafD
MKMPVSVAARRIVLGCSIALAFATLAGYAASWRYLEIMGDFRPYYLFTSLFLLILGIGLAQLEPHRRGSIWTIALASLAIMINTLEVGPWITSSAAAVNRNPARADFRAISFNVEQNNPRIPETMQYLRSQEADVVVLLESVGSWPKTLAELDSTYPHHLRLDGLTMDVFSRHPMIQSQVHQFGPQRGFATVELQLPRSRLWLVAAHACPRHAYGADGFRERVRMLEEGIPAVLTKLQGTAVVLGDFNASVWSPAYKLMLRRSHLADARRGFGLLSTQHGKFFPGNLLWRPIDHCFHTADCGPRRIWTGPDLGSDHLPLVVDLEFWTGSHPYR